MARIVGAQERLGVVLYGRYMSGSWGCTEERPNEFLLPYDFFSQPNYKHTNFDSRGIVPTYHGYRINSAGVYADTDDAELQHLLETEAEANVAVQSKPVYATKGLRCGKHTVLRRTDALAELRGEDGVEAPPKSTYNFVLYGPFELGDRVRSATRHGSYVELLAWTSGLLVRDIL